MGGDETFWDGNNREGMITYRYQPEERREKMMSDDHHLPFVPSVNLSLTTVSIVDHLNCLLMGESRIFASHHQV